MPAHPPDPGLPVLDPSIVLDPGVVKTVAWLRERGFHTTDSGDGRTKPKDESVSDIAHVIMVLDNTSEIEPEATRLADLVRDQCGHTEGVLIEATYSPLDGGTTLSLFSADDRTLDEVLFASGADLR